MGFAIGLIGALSWNARDMDTVASESTRESTRESTEQGASGAARTAHAPVDQTPWPHHDDPPQSLSARRQVTGQLTSPIAADEVDTGAERDAEIADDYAAVLSRAAAQGLISDPDAEE